MRSMLVKHVLLSIILTLVTRVSALSCQGDGPLESCSWGIVVKGGITPTLRTEQGCIWSTNPCFANDGTNQPCTGCLSLPPAPVTPVFSVSKTAKFKEQFKLPATFGLELQYNLDERHMLYLEYDYRHAKSKTFAFVAGRFSNVETSNNYVSNAGYVGFRNYFNRIWCDRLSFLAGGKLGIIHRNEICAALNVAVPSLDIPQTFVGAHPYFFADNAVSAGLHIGFDVAFNDCFSFQFNAEVVASAGHKVNQNAVFGVSGSSSTVSPSVLTALLGLTNINIGTTGTEVQFPITFGIRYTY